MNQSTVTPTARVYIVLVILVTAPFGLLLYLYPSGSGRRTCSIWTTGGLALYLGVARLTPSSASD